MQPRVIPSTMPITISCRSTLEEVPAFHLAQGHGTRDQGGRLGAGIAAGRDAQPGTNRLSTTTSAMASSKKARAEKVNTSSARNRQASQTARLHAQTSRNRASR